MKKIMLFIVAISLFGSVYSQTYIRDAELGDREAQFRLGRMYQRADRMPKDIDKAIYWYNQAAEQGQPDAVLALAELYFYGVETERKPHLAYTLFLKSADNKNPEAYFCLGELLYYGQGVEKDINRAFAWYKQAADEGDLAKAQYKVGVMLFEGSEVKQNKDLGVQYIKKAFQNGYPTALDYWKEKKMWEFEK